MSRSCRIACLSWCLLVVAVGLPELVRADDLPKARFMLEKFQPLQAGVEYEQPEAAEVSKCRVEIDRGRRHSGWKVVGSSGQVLRRFLDTNGNNLVDQWRYFQNGVEVYRDIDGNHNGKVDQSRWLNTGGSRWALDSNEDGRIDSWKRISAEETSRVAVEALLRRDAGLLQTVLITAQDTRMLGIEAKLEKSLLAAVADPAMQMAKIGAMAAGTRWIRFDCSQPGLIPADSGKATGDLEVYESTLAIVDAGGNSGLVQIGELVKVGQAWKLTSIPSPLSGDTVQVTAGGLLLQPAAPSIAVAASGLSPRMQKLLGQLRELDGAAPAVNATRAAVSRYHARRSDVLSGLSQSAATPSARDQWRRQLIDDLALLVESGTWPDALGKLAAEEIRLRKVNPKAPLVPFVTYRHLEARYRRSMRAATEQAAQDKAQQVWLADLERFIATYPKAEDTPEAAWRLGTAHEFAARVDDAKAWYSKLARQYARTPAGERAAGALVRLDLKGKPLVVAGRSLANTTVRSDAYRGKVLLVVYWATWCKPCTEELPALQALYAQYRARGFEILGVNLDLDRTPVPAYISSHRITWATLHEDGGLDSRLARQLGILSLPTMVLLDRRGTVVSSETTVADLKTELPKLLGTTATGTAP
jgi:thiol-disulfide isomerase/thioredoxin